MLLIEMKSEMYSAAVFIIVLVAILYCSETALAQDRIVCPRVASTNQRTRLQASDEKANFVEVSGLGFSPTLVGPSGEPIVYAINDGGGGRRFGVFDSGTGARILSLRLPRSLPDNLDYESLTVGSCGIDDGDCIYIADVGDNTARDTGGTASGHGGRGYPIYKIQEPNFDSFEDNDILPENMVSTLWFNYLHPSSPTQFSDCEAVFLDNVGWGGEVGDFYMVTKWDDYYTYSANTLNRLFRIPAQAWTQAKEDVDFVFSPETVGFYENGINSNPLMGYQWTRAEMTLDGTLIALGDYYDQYLFLRCPGMSVAEALTVQGRQYCETWPTKYWNSQFETIAWTPDKSRTLEISECYWGPCNPGPPMVWTTMDYTYYPASSVACPTAEVGATAMTSGPPSTSFPTEMPVTLPVSLPTSLPPSLPTLLPTLLPMSLPTPLPTSSPTSSPTSLPSLPFQAPPTTADDGSPTTGAVTASTTETDPPNSAGSLPPLMTSFTILLAYSIGAGLV